MIFRFDTTNVTKEYLLSKNSQETYLSYYLGVPVSKKLVCNPLRDDKRPTASFYKNKQGDIIFKDFGSNFSGNFISVVMAKYNCSYYMALQIIANDFGYIKHPKLIKCDKPITISKVHLEETKEAQIQIQPKDFSQEELNWWWNFGITEKTLKKFRVFSCNAVFLNNKLFLMSDPKHPIFGYYRGKSKNNNELWRIYMPKHRRRDPKFISNWKSTMIQGSKQLPKTGDMCVITKSMKDVMSLYEFGITAIAPNSETIFLTDKQLEKLKKRFKRIIVFYDNDRAGMYNMAKIRHEHPELEYFMIPKSYKCKDFSDLVCKFGVIKVKEFISNFKNEVERVGPVS